MPSIQKSSRASNGGPIVPWGVVEAFIHETDAKLHELSAKAARATDETSLSVYFALRELDDKWCKAQDALLKELEKLKAVEQKVRTATDSAKVQAHLARADAVDAVEAMLGRVRRIERRLRDFKVRATKAPSPSPARSSPKSKRKKAKGPGSRRP